MEVNHSLRAASTPTSDVAEVKQKVQELSSQDVKLKKMNPFKSVINRLTRGAVERRKYSGSEKYKQISALNISISRIKSKAKDLMNERKSIERQLRKNGAGESELRSRMNDIDDELDSLYSQLESLNNQIDSLDRSLTRTVQGAKFKARILKLGKAIKKHQASSSGYVRHEVRVTASRVKEAYLTNSLVASGLLSRGKAISETRIERMEARLNELQEMENEGVLRLDSTNQRAAAESLDAGEVLCVDIKNTDLLSGAKNEVRRDRENYQNLDSIKRGLVRGVPPVELGAAASVKGASIESFDYNTYGLDMEVTFGELDETTLEVTVTYKEDGEEKTLTRPARHGLPETVDGSVFLSAQDAQSADKVGSGETNGVRFWTVADGAGSEAKGRVAAEKAVSGCNAGFEQGLQRGAPANLREAAQIMLDNVDLAQKGVLQDEVGQDGKATVSQTMVVGDYVLSFQMGDTSNFVLRPNGEGGYTAIPLAPLQEGHNPKDPEGGVGANKVVDDEPKVIATVPDFRSARFAAFKLQPGDMVVSGSDGIGDNLSAEELAEATRGAQSPREVGEKIHTRVKEKVTPWLKKSIIEGVSDREIKKDPEIQGKPDHLGFMIYQHGQPVTTD